MAAAEQPLKKRKLYDPPPPSPPAEPSPPPPEPPRQPPRPSTPLSLSEEEILQRRRSKEEIRNIFSCYKRIKFCIDQKDKRSMPELKEAYLSLISAARGCAHAKCLAAEYITRYASCCPAVLESAADAIMSLYEWSFDVISKGNDIDGNAFETAKACIFGLANICQAAASEATTAAAAQAISSTVFLNLFTVFASSFKGKDIFDIVGKSVLKIYASEESFSDFKHKFLEEDNSKLAKLSKLHALSFLKILFSCPKDSLVACFDLFKSSGNEGAQKGKYFFHQLTAELNDIGVQNMDEGDDGSSNYFSSTNCELKRSPENCPASKEKSSSNCSSSILKNCLLGLVLRKDTALKSVVFSRYRFLSQSESPEVVSDITSVLEGVFESFALQVKVEDSHIDGGACTPGSSKSANQGLLSGISNQQGSPVISGRDYPDKISGIHLNRQSFSPRAITPRDFRSNSFNGRNHSPHVERGATSSMDLSLPSSRSSSVAASSPFESPSPRQAICSPHSSTSHVVWFSDGDPAAMDIFPASKQLWLGSLGPDVTEMLIKYQFEKFGPIEQLQYYPFKGYATIEFRNIMDALKAREVMRGRSLWGTCLRIKFLDTGLGTRGVINGTAIGSSCHVYVGNVASIQAKDEMLHEVKKVLHKAPRAVVDVSSEGALLMEFDSPQEATIAIAHLRWYRKESVKFHPPSSNVVPPNVVMNAEDARPATGSVHVDTRNAIPGHGLSGSLHDQIAMDNPSEGRLARTSGLSSLLAQLRAKYNITRPQGSFENHIPGAPMREHERPATNTLWINIPNINPSCITDDELLAVCNLAISNTGSVVRISRTSMPAGPYWFVECSSPDTANTLLKNLRECPGIFFQIEFSNSAMHHVATPSVRPDGGSLELTSPRICQENYRPMMQNMRPFQSTWTAGASSPSFSAHTPGSSIPPPQPVQAPGFVRPVYPPPNSLWDPRGMGHHYPPKPIPSTGMAPHAHTNMRGPPFLPASVTPLAQIQGSSVAQFDPLFPRPVVPPPLSSLPPPPSNAPPPSLLPPQPNFRPPLPPHPELQPPLPPAHPPPAPPPPPPYSLPLAFPPPPSSPPPPPPSAVAGTESRSSEHYGWQGILSKSGVYYCTLHAQRVDSDICRYSNVIAEPAEWPAKLDMTKRTDFQHVKSTFSSTPPNRREICWLLPSTHGDHKGFQDFISYLQQRNCAGVIKLPSSKSLWARLLFILPYSPETCSLLSIPANPSLCLIGLVVPKETNSELT
ncbi:uncharacterized protein LOC127246311 [Andrographis paniculata]|uniref:uncharacterized protein LOC127246311 n=1 Tax=Andrographis paniculata TaxID=175694 RepID=UPI0021E92233|nr:uncharacterized protein LOC127246311 [Andrographis paniculata]